MKRILLAAAILLTAAVPARADLDGFLAGLNVQAKADLGAFSVRLGAQFGVPLPQVQEIVKQVEVPADAFMVLQLGEAAKKPPEVVVQSYRKHKGKGWGVVAKELGIKPGSAAFHALKQGNYAFTGEPKGHGKEKGPEKAKGGHGKEKGKGNK